METGDGVDWHSPGPPGEPIAQDGIHLIDLIGGGAGKIQQDVPTTPDTVYTLSFYYTTHSLFACSAPGRSAVVTAGSSSTVVSSEPSNVWKPGSLAFAGSAGSTTTISFQSIENFGCGGVVIDNVSVEQVLPSDANQCKKGGWETFGVFTNQGDCVSFIATGGKNEPGKNVP